jgi:hypothetical protein
VLEIPTADIRPRGTSGSRDSAAFPYAGWPKGLYNNQLQSSGDSIRWIVNLGTPPAWQGLVSEARAIRSRTDPSRGRRSLPAACELQHGIPGPRADIDEGGRADFCSP